MSVPTHVKESLETCPRLAKPCVLTIGTFDGVHTGHQAILHYMQQTAADVLPKVVLTFSNHPSEVVRADKPSICLISAKHKVHLLQKNGVDLVLLLPFTQQLSQLSAKQFIQSILVRTPINHIVLGHDARIGYEREGDVHFLRQLGELLGFSVSQLAPFSLEGKVVSSTRIRQHIQGGELQQAKKLLGRSPSFFGLAQAGLGIGKSMGFPTLNLDVTGLCTPPHGVYAVEVCSAGRTSKGIANLGIAPTVRSDKIVLLEAHIFSYSGGFENQEIEVSLKAFIRPERKFISLEELRTQIASDIQQAKKIHEEATS